jgi:hypothetical protein
LKNYKTLKEKQLGKRKYRLKNHTTSKEGAMKRKNHR